MDIVTEGERASPDKLPVEPGPLGERLLSPGTRSGLDELADHWFHQVIVLRLRRPPELDAPLEVLNRVRGALGKGLMRSASREAINGMPCPFDPPCAFDVLFREQIRLHGKFGLPKPWVLAIEVGRRSMEIRLTVFGMACQWIEAVRERLVESVQEAVRWSNDVRKRERSDVLSAEILTGGTMKIPPAPPAIVMNFLTPFDASGTDFRVTPSTVVARLARRVDALARWMDVEVETRWQEIADAWHGARFSVADLQGGVAVRGSRRQRKVYENDVVNGSILIEGDLAPFWPLLMLGQTCHVGRGATVGYGRYVLEEA